MSEPIDKILLEEGENRQLYFNAIAPPVIQSSIYAFDTVADFQDAISREHETHVYSKGRNPTVRILESKLAALEQCEDALVVGSGTSAMSLAIMSQLSAGDHVVCVRNPYSWTGALLNTYLRRFGISVSFVSGEGIGHFAEAITNNTKVMVLESPNTLTFDIQDLQACSKLAKSKGLITIIDNSLATPLFQQPRKYGIDLIVHSLSKYIGGHSDVVAGVICGSRKLIKQIFYDEYMHLGPAVSPHDAALIIRGLRTLPIRMERIAATSLAVMEFLKTHPKVMHVFYPFDPDFPQYALAKSQMKSGSGLITFEVEAENIEQMLTFVNTIQRFKLAVSWGGPESLILPVAALYNLKGRDNPAASWKTVRISIGLESPEYLIEDLTQAFKTLRS